VQPVPLTNEVGDAVVAVVDADRYLIEETA
jgi:hypothetical protein